MLESRYCIEKYELKESLVPVSVDTVRIDWDVLLTDPFKLSRERLMIEIDAQGHPLLAPGLRRGVVTHVAPCDDGVGHQWWPIRVVRGLPEPDLFLNLSRKGDEWDCFLFVMPPGGLRVTAKNAQQSVPFGERFYRPLGSGLVTIDLPNGRTISRQMADWGDDSGDHHLFWSEGGLFGPGSWEVVGRRISLENVRAC